jgi:glycosyltransferase involved in cell wall biosynthesis
MIKVAHVVEDLKIGGLERIIENIVMSLDAQRYETYVLCLSRGGAIADKLVAQQKNVEILNIKNYHNPLSILKVVTWLKRKKIDIVHTHAYSAGVLGRVAAIIAKVPYIFHHVHSTYSYLHKRNYFIEKFLSRFTHKILCCSEAVKRFVSEKEGISEDRLVVIYNGTTEPNSLNISAAHGLKKKLRIPQNASVIGCVATLVPHKGHRYLLEAFKKIENGYLLLVGNGPIKTDLDKIVFELGISNRVIFTGSQIDVAPYMQVMDIVVLPSSEVEGLGISLIEAMAVSKPVVATKIGGVPEVVDDGNTGLLVKPKDSDALTKAINTLLNAPDLAQKMGINGRKKYQELFTLKYMIKRMEEMYEGCI